MTARLFQRPVKNTPASFFAETTFNDMVRGRPGYKKLYGICLAAASGTCLQIFRQYDVQQYGDQCCDHYR